MGIRRLLSIFTLVLVASACAWGITPAEKAQIQYDKGALFEKQGKYTEAIAEWRKIDQQEQDTSDSALALVKATALQMIGESLRELNQLDEAQATFAKVLKDYPKCRSACVDAAIGIAKIYQAKEDYLNAAKEYANVMRYYPDKFTRSDFAQIRLDSVRKKLTDIPPALQDELQGALDIYYKAKREDEAITAARRAARAKVEYGDVESAKKDLLAQFSNPAVLASRERLGYLGDAQLTVGDRDNARVTLEKYLTLANTELMPEEYRLAQIKVHYDLYDYDKAITESKEALSIYPEGGFASQFQYYLDESVKEKNGNTKADKLISQHKYNEALAILIPLASSPEPAAQDAKGALERCYRASKQWDKAISLIESCIKEYPDNKTLWQTRLGRCYKEMGDNTKAIAVFKNGLDSTTRTPQTTQALTDFLWQCYSEKNDWAAAISYYQLLLIKYPEDAAEWCYQLGRCYWSAGKSVEAITELEKALELAKGNPEAAKRIAPVLSIYYVSSGKFEKEEALFKKLDQEYPSCSAYWASYQATMLLHRGTSHLDKGEYAAAIPFYQKLLDRFARIPECWDSVESAYIYVVFCLVGLGKTDEAAAFAKKLSEERPDMRVSVLATRGMVSFAQKNYDDAYAAFRQLISDYPSNIHVHLAQSYIPATLNKAGRTDEAVDMIRASLAAESSPEMKAAILFRIANVYYKAKKYRDAVKVYKEVRNLKGAPAEMKAEAAYRTGFCYYEIKSYNSARRCMENVIKLYPDSEWAKKARGMIYVWDNFGTNVKVSP